MHNYKQCNAPSTIIANYALRRDPVVGTHNLKRLRQINRARDNIIHRPWRPTDTTPRPARPAPHCANGERRQCQMPRTLSAPSPAHTTRPGCAATAPACKWSTSRPARTHYACTGGCGIEYHNSTSRLDITSRHHNSHWYFFFFSRP